MTVYTEELPNGMVIKKDEVVFIGVENNEGSDLSEGFNSGAKTRRDFHSASGE